MSVMDAMGVLRFDEAFVERIWGGRRLASLYGKPLPPDVRIGESWLIADHRQCESAVAHGPLKGKTLRQLLAQDAQAILGKRARLTVHGRFPLLLKILDAQDVLSIQVHPDDACARALGEPDVGKTEMWHVLHADPGSELYCGLDPALTPGDFDRLAAEGGLEKHVPRLSVQAGDSVFVPAGTVHAIGGGLVLAEIQQNSDLTYRLYDWNRAQNDGKPRELHVGKGKAAIRFGEAHPGKTRALALSGTPAPRSILAACPHFAAELITLQQRFERETRRDSFHILLAVSGEIHVTAGAVQETLHAGSAALVPGQAETFVLTGAGQCLDYYTPDLEQDIAGPALAAGYSRADLAGLNPAFAGA